MENYDCKPTLNDSEVLEVCKNGFLMLEGVVPDKINKKTIEYVNSYSNEGQYVPSSVQRDKFAGNAGQPVALLNEDWFVENILLNPQAAGAVRSLLGKNFGLPNLIGNHRTETPLPAQEWHVDGGSIYGPEVNYLQVFYYPQACPRDLGPTELLPGSHFLFSLQGYMGHYGRIRNSYHATAPAGSIFITVYNIWHRRSESATKGIRNNLKYNYWRTVEPTRDWVIDPGFDIGTADYAIGEWGSTEQTTYRQQFRDRVDSAEMYTWLCGESEKFKVIGGQGWPKGPRNYRGEKPYGIPKDLT